MLILSRRIGEKIMIGDAITIVVIDIRNNGKVRIGIEAPPDTRIDRAECQGSDREISELMRRPSDGE